MNTGWILTAFVPRSGSWASDGGVANASGTKSPIGKMASSVVMAGDAAEGVAAIVRVEASSLSVEHFFPILQASTSKPASTSPRNEAVAAGDHSPSANRAQTPDAAAAGINQRGRCDATSQPRNAASRRIAQAESLTSCGRYKRTVRSPEAGKSKETACQ